MIFKSCFGMGVWEIYLGLQTLVNNKVSTFNLSFLDSAIKHWIRPKQHFYPEFNAVALKIQHILTTNFPCFFNQ